VVAGLGVCLSDLVVSQPSGTTDAPPLPSISGLNNPTVITTSSSRLAWWQILLMALGCAFILLVIIWLFRRHQRKQRAKRAAQFAKGLNPSVKKERTGWRWKLLRFFGEKLFCHSRSRRVPIARGEDEDIKLSQLRMMEEARPVASFATDANNNVDPSGEGGREEDMVQLIESYNPLPEAYYTNRHVRVHLVDQQSLSDSSSQHTAPSIYSQVTGLPQNVPEPRQPLKSRFSMSTFATNEGRKNNHSKKAFWK
jgi:cbb3-type cytochrome oxidase subunit 3